MLPPRKGFCSRHRLHRLPCPLCKKDTVKSIMLELNKKNILDTPNNKLSKRQRMMKRIAKPMAVPWFTIKVLQMGLEREYPKDAGVAEKKTLQT